MNRRTRIPRTILLNGETFRVRHKKRLVYDGEKCLGLMRYLDGELDIKTGQRLQMRVEVLWHELFHGMLIQAGVPTSEHNDDQIDIIAHGVAQALRDNPRLRDLL